MKNTFRVAAIMLGLMLATTCRAEDEPCANMPEVWKTLEAVLHLDSPYQVPCQAISLEELTTSMADEIDTEEQYPLDRQESTARLLGFDLGEIGLRESTLNMLEDQVAGFYDSDEDTFFVVTGRDDLAEMAKGMEAEEVSTMTGIMAQIVLIHEGHHAIQDHWIDLDSLIEANPHDWDRVQAARTIVEGDASLIMLIGLFHQSGLEGEQISGAMGDTAGVMAAQPMPEMEGVPRLMAYSLGESYSMGVDYLLPVYLEEGVAGLKQVLLNVPQSMATIMDLPPPEDIPKDMFLTGNITDHGHLGPYFLRIWLLDQGATEDQAAQLIKGYRGDRFVILGQGQKESLTWVLAAEHAFAARKLARKLENYLPPGMEITIRDRFISMFRLSGEITNG